VPRGQVDVPIPCPLEGRTALARDVFDAGERDAVRAYLEASLRDAERVARRVESGDSSGFTGQAEIEAWLAALGAGQRPAFPDYDR